MHSSIRAICFDVGGTLRATQKIEGRDLDYIRKLQSFVGETGTPEVFACKIHQREMEYRRWCTKSLVELSEADLWMKFLLPEYPNEFIRENSVKLNQMWRESRTKELLPDAAETIKALASRGYTLAIISNTTSSIEAPQLLAENGIADLFSSVILSTVFGRRKPHPSLFLAAAREMDVLPEQCAYVGDTLSRDLVGARQAGFGEVVIINIQSYQLNEFDPDDELLTDAITEMKPDFKIGRLSELLDFYPQSSLAQNAKVAPSSHPDHFYDVAISTMWGVDQLIPFNETFLEARRIGFARFELNHKVSPALYTEWDSNRFYVATVHDPCPAMYTDDEMRRKDILISSLDEVCRGKSVDQIKRTVDLACKLGSKSVVVHPGTIMCDRSRDNHLRELYQKGLRGKPEYDALKVEMAAHRAKFALPHVESVMKSLTEIIDYARHTGISIGLENRYRFYHLPLPDEMELFLDLCKEDWFGFQYDIGHAHALDTLGLVEHQEWLSRFHDRMIGVHLHDVIGIIDHQVPGQGDVDFKKIATFLPDSAYKTLEVGPQASISELASGLAVLTESGCIQQL